MRNTSRLIVVEGQGIDRIDLSHVTCPLFPVPAGATRLDSPPKGRYTPGRPRSPRDRRDAISAGSVDRRDRDGADRGAIEPSPAAASRDWRAADHPALSRPAGRSIDSTAWFTGRTVPAICPSRPATRDR